MSDVTTRGSLRFGVFEVDLDARELRKRGIRIKLQDKPFDLLEALLERAGDFVTREQLSERLWMGEAPADVNRNLNKAINKLRTALGDSPDTPRFIETKPRLGYRFLAPVENIELPAEAAPATPPALMPEPQPPTEPAAEASLQPARERRGLPKWTIAAAFLALIALALVVLMSLRMSTPPSIVGSRQLTNDARQKVAALCTDGRHIYFSEFRDGRVLPAQVSAEGGETTLIPTPFDPKASVFVLDVARDGGQLLIKTGSGVNPETNEDPLWILSPTSGMARRVGDVAANDARWSPNGDLLAYSAGENLYIANRDGSSPRLIARKPGNNSDIVWSPDAARLRFRTAFPGRYHTALWEVRADGSGLRQVFPDWEFEQQFGDWGPDSRFFVFFSPTDSKLWLSMEPWRPFSGSQRLERLSSGPMRFLYPRLGPDRRTMYAIGEIRRGELLRWDFRAGRFVAYRPGLSAEQLHFTPDGAWLTYATFPENNLWRSRADGSNRLQLTFHPMQVYLPRFSPDASQIAFMGRLPRGRWRAYVISADGGTPRQLVDGEGTEADPNWSPDGRRIVYAPFPWEVRPQQTQIRIVDLATQEISVVPGSEGLFSPRWSPDGRRLFALQESGGPRVYDLQTATWTSFPFLGGFPAWSGDGHFVYVFHAFTDERGIYRFDVRTQQVEKVASLHGIDVAGALGPYGLSLAPDDSPVVLRDLSIQEIYAFDLR
ncbi:MAG: winged helix-turn-helix domain-containing protein [Bryobacteraceae bacterium]|nr:winged helix-turn-helix domain-containing protein [Bryobacteraceae bacterium]